jgi:copper transport protein
LRRGGSRKGPLAVVGLAIAVGIMLTPGIAGHASAGRWVALAIPVDALHLLAMAAWFGGLTVLAIEVLRSNDVDAVEPAVDRFSRIGIVAVGVVVATGAMQSFRQLEQFSDLWDSSYGRLLLVKLGAFAALMVVASASRDIVRFEIRRSGRRQRLASPLPAGPGAMRAAPELDDPEDTVRRLRSAVWYEVAFAVAILAVTAVLVNEAPARAGGSNEPYQATLTTDDRSINFDVSVTPAQVGQNQMHITALQPTGEIMPLLELTVTLSAPEEDVAPMDVQLVRVGGGSHYQSTGLSIPFPGTWEVEVTGLVSDVDEVTVTDQFDVGT